MKKYLFFFLILFSCNTQDFIISSTYQQWIGGRPETGSGTNYRFKMIALDSHNNFHIEKIKAHQRVLNHSIEPQIFQKGDTLKVFAYKSKEVWNSDTICKIQYILNKKTFSIEPKEFIKLEKLYYP